MRAILAFACALTLIAATAVGRAAVMTADHRQIADNDDKPLPPGEREASRIEAIYYQQGPQKALQALAQDYADAFAHPDHDAGREQIGAEFSRLQAHAARYAQYSPLVGIATQWCLERHAPDDFPLRYDALMPAGDSSPDTPAAVLELDRDMAGVVQDNWTHYGNLTRTRTYGYVTDEQQITIKSSNDLRRDQQEQEDVRAAANALRR